MPEPILESRNLVKHFGALLATDDLSLDLMPGELHAIIGPNGAGKTTLVMQLAGELVPSAGRIFLAGTDITGLALRKRVSRTQADSAAAKSIGV